MSSVDRARTERYRERLREEWTAEAIVSARRKWQASLSAFTPGVSEAFFPEQPKAFRECLRVLKPGGRVAFVGWCKREQPFLGTTVGVLAKCVDVPPPEPGAPHAFMFGERDLLKSQTEASGYAQVSEDVQTVSARWPGPPRQHRQQFTKVAAPFRSLIAKSTGDTRVRAQAEILAELPKFYDGSTITMPLESVTGTGIRT